MKILEGSGCFSGLIRRMGILGISILGFDYAFFLNVKEFMYF
jgi:hypothetical protein